MKYTSLEHQIRQIHEAKRNTAQLAGIKKMQTELGVKADGIVGKKTKAAMSKRGDLSQNMPMPPAPAATPAAPAKQTPSTTTSTSTSTPKSSASSTPKSSPEVDTPKVDKPAFDQDAEVAKVKKAHSDYFHDKAGKEFVEKSKIDPDSDKGKFFAKSRGSTENSLLKGSRYDTGVDEETIDELYGSGTAEIGKEGKGSNNRINPQFSSSKTRGHGAASDTSRSKQAQSETANKSLKAEEFVDEGVGSALKTAGKFVLDLISPRHTKKEPEEVKGKDKSTGVAGSNKPVPEPKPKSEPKPDTIQGVSGTAKATFQKGYTPNKVTVGKPKLSIRAASNKTAAPAAIPKVSSGGAKGKDLGLDPSNPEHAKLIAKIQAAQQNEEFDINQLVNYIIEEKKKEDGAGKSALGKAGDVADTAAEILVPGYDAYKKFKAGDYTGAAVSGGIDVLAGAASIPSLGGAWAARTAAKGALKAGEKATAKQTAKKSSETTAEKIGRRADNAMDVAGAVMGGGVAKPKGDMKDEPVGSSAPTTTRSQGEISSKSANVSSNVKKPKFSSKITMGPRAPSAPKQLSQIISKKSRG